MANILKYTSSNCVQNYVRTIRSHVRPSRSKFYYIWNAVQGHSRSYSSWFI